MSTSWPSTCSGSTAALLPTWPRTVWLWIDSTRVQQQMDSRELAIARQVLSPYPNDNDLHTPRAPPVSLE